MTGTTVQGRAREQQGGGATTREASREEGAGGSEQVEIRFERQDAEHARRVDRVGDERAASHSAGIPLTESEPISTRS